MVNKDGLTTSEENFSYKNNLYKNTKELENFKQKNEKENIKNNKPLSGKLISKTNYNEIIKNAREKSLKDENNYKKVSSDKSNNKLF